MVEEKIENMFIRYLEIYIILLRIGFIAHVHCLFEHVFLVFIKVFRARLQTWEVKFTMYSAFIGIICFQKFREAEDYKISS